MLTVSEINLWGLDLSGTRQGAGGVSGLLAVNTVSPQSVCYPAYDGNGNTIAWSGMAGVNGIILQRIDYDPFGNVVTREGGAGFEAPAWGFSTKYQDKETGLLYYGYRFFDPKTGRWLSKDPIEESGSANLYEFSHNNGATYIDILGLAWMEGTVVAEPRGFAHPVGDWKINPLFDYAVHKGLMAQALGADAVNSLASKLMVKYLSPTAGDFNISGYIPKMLSSDHGWWRLVNARLRDGARRGDEMIGGRSQIIMYETMGGNGWEVQAAGSMYTHYTIGDFHYALEINIERKDKYILRMNYSIKVFDVYDFDDTNDTATPFSKDAAWHRMQRVGLAMHFKVKGQMAGKEEIWCQGNPPQHIFASGK